MWTSQESRQCQTSSSSSELQAQPSSGSWHSLATRNRTKWEEENGFELHLLGNSLPADDSCLRTHTYRFRQSLLPMDQNLWTTRENLLRPWQRVPQAISNHGGPERHLPGPRSTWSTNTEVYHREIRKNFQGGVSKDNHGDRSDDLGGMAWSCCSCHCNNQQAFKQIWFQSSTKNVGFQPKTSRKHA